MKKKSQNSMEKLKTRLTQPHSFRIFSATLLLLMGSVLSAQNDDGPTDPLLGGYHVGVSDEVVVLWADFTGSGGGFFHHRLYDYASKNNPEEANEIIAKGGDSIAGQLPVRDILDVFSEDIDGDGFDDVVSCWTGSEEHPIQIVVRQVDTASYEFMDAGVVNVLEGSEMLGTKTLVRLIPGNFDQDAEKEFLLSYLGPDTTIRILLYDTDGTLVPQRKGVLQADAIHLGDHSFMNYDVGTGDFDGDGMDEIVLAGSDEIHIYEPGLNKEIDKETMTLNIYDVKKDDTYIFQPGVREAEIDLLPYLIRDNRLNFQLHGIRLTSVDLNSNAVDEIAVGYQVTQGDSIYYLLQAFRTNVAMDSLFYSPGKESVHTKLNKEDASGGGSMSITAGDLTGNGHEEVVFGAWDNIKIYTATEELDLNQVAVFGDLNPSLFSNDRNNRTVVVTDLDASLSQDQWHKEVVVVHKVEYGEFSKKGLDISVYEAELQLSGELRMTRRASYPERSITLENDSPIAVVTGNFEGDGMRLGTPRSYRETNVFQPLVVVNAPPVHFDMFGEVMYDISNCFSGGDCNFIATYKEGVSLTEQISSQINSDWGLERKLYTENEIAGIKLNAHLTTTYGGNFSKVQNSSKTVAVSVEVEAVHDDMIYATVGDYTIWEYPVYSDGILQGYMSTVVPELVENRWFPSKSWSGNRYIPNHEPGNILSYPDLTELEEITAENEPIKGLLNNNYGLGPNTNYTWSLEFSDFEENSASTSHKVGIEVGRDVGFGTEGSTEVSAAPFGIGGSVSIDYKIQVGRSLTGNFNLESFSSHTTTVKKDLSLEVKLGGTVGPETGYQIRPFSYWSESGILVIDYAVNVDEAAQGYTPTWWQDAYGTMPDPAFILPWRLDPEKGYALNSELKRSQTKDIVIYPKDPQPGDTILVYARIHNFSLLPTQDPVRISFYLGDPDESGELITSNDGQTMLATETALAPRSSQWIHMEWIMPEKGRLFAVLDPENTMSEIHESNNKGWIAIGPEDYTTGIPGDPEVTSTSVPEDLRLFNYPNPFNKSTVIAFNLHKGQQASIRVKDLSGRDVYMRDTGYWEAGNHQIEFDGGFLREGTYILNLELDSGEVFSHMMIVL